MGVEILDCCSDAQLACRWEISLARLLRDRSASDLGSEGELAARLPVVVLHLAHPVKARLASLIENFQTRSDILRTLHLVTAGF